MTFANPCFGFEISYLNFSKIDQVHVFMENFVIQVDFFQKSHGDYT